MENTEINTENIESKQLPEDAGEHPVKKKKIRLKSHIVYILFGCCGVVLGQLLATLTQNVPFLAWLSFSVDFGLTIPLELDFGILTLVLGAYITISPSMVIFTAASLLIARIVLKRR